MTSYRYCKVFAQFGAYCQKELIGYVRSPEELKIVDGFIQVFSDIDAFEITGVRASAVLSYSIKPVIEESQDSESK